MRALRRLLSAITGGVGIVLVGELNPFGGDPRGEWLVLLSRKVAAAFGRSDARAFTACARERLIFLPHPSGRCHEWNDPAAAPRARSLVGRALAGAITPA